MVLRKQQAWGEGRGTMRPPARFRRRPGGGVYKSGPGIHGLTPVARRYDPFGVAQGGVRRLSSQGVGGPAEITRTWRGAVLAATGL
jgi:hypothetical protein